ncbi:pseudouridine synthase [Streptococcaceae bacterium ESL0687]|nr:pseudouridine synthase [Streptococcaceae bacterium ESL0687]
MRLDKFLANMNLGSRTEVKKDIKKGQVTVNGQVIKSDKHQINEEADQITFRGQLVNYQKYFYYLLNKPAGYLSAKTDTRDKTIMDLFKASDRRDDLFPVGRLDKDTEGLLLVTNDGDLAHRLLSPKKHVPKLYQAEISGIMTGDDIKLFAEGLTIDGGELCLPAELELVSVNPQEDTSLIRLTLHEGKFHQVKRMVKAVGKKVTYLERLGMGNLMLDDNLKRGAYRPLSDKDLEKLDLNN